MVGILDLLLFLVPVYVSNSIPVLLGGGKPLDLGVVLSDGERLFGEGKTIRGFLAGVSGGTAAGGAVALTYALPFFSDQQTQFTASFVLAFTAITGDAIGSFFKRRLKIPSGKPFLPDTVFFLIFALIFSYSVVGQKFYEPFNIIFCIALTAILHPLTNIIANKAGLKKVPW